MARPCHDDTDIPPHTLMERRSRDHRLGRCLPVTSDPPLLPRAALDPCTLNSPLFLFLYMLLTLVI
jgi:hypothetical protein